MQNCNSKLKIDIKQRAYKFGLAVLKFISKFPSRREFWVIGDQLLRCATSIGANIIEARASSSRREFKKFIEIALKSANETKFWLCLLRDSELLEDTSKVKELLAEAVELSNILGASVISLKKK